MMMRAVFSVAALAALLGCAAPVPDSGAGVGFDRVDADRARADRGVVLAGGAPPPGGVLSDEAVGVAPDRDGGVLQASPANPAPEAVTATGISAENDFSRVEDLRSIESDAERLRRNRAQYTVIQPTDLPSRPGGTGPNIVAFALATTNAPGDSLYRRTGFNAEARRDRNCAKYAAPDQAQAAFLATGGPERDRMGLDPDGDGFACDWDPRPFRRARAAN